MSPPDAPAPPQPPRPPAWPRARSGLAALAAGGALTLAAALGGAWWWAGSEGSLAQTMRWAERALADRPALGALSVHGARGSLRHGGTIERLDWSRDGLGVHAEGVKLTLTGRFWRRLLSGRGVFVQALHADRLRIDDRRPPDPTSAAPPTDLGLPVAVRLGWSVDTLVWGAADAGPLARGLRGRYSHGASPEATALGVREAHLLTLEQIDIAGGRYQATLALGAAGHLPLRLDITGRVDDAPVPGGAAVSLQAEAQVAGALGGADASLQARARLQPDTAAGATPTLAATATLRPWAAQPLTEADLRLHQLDVGRLWPQAPTTALSGTARAQPAAGGGWTAALDLSNALPGPADRQRLPLASLRVRLHHDPDGRWRADELVSAVGGGEVRGEGHWQPAASPRGTGALDLRLRGVNPALLWSRLAPAALDGAVTADAGEALRLSADLAPAGRQPRASAADALRLREGRLRGRWLPASADWRAGTLEIDTLRLRALDGELTAQGRWTRGTPAARGTLQLALPGLNAEARGAIAARDGGGTLRLALDDARRALAWAHSLRAAPWIGPALAQAWPALASAQASGRATASLRWDGGLGGFGLPGGAPAAPPTLDLDLQARDLNVSVTAAGDGQPPWRVDRLEARLRGRADELALRLTAGAGHGAWSGTVDTAGQLRLRPVGRPGWPDGQLHLDRLGATLRDARRASAPVVWSLDSLSAPTLSWSGLDSRPRWDAGSARWTLAPRVERAARAAGAGGAAGAVTLGWSRLRWEAGALTTDGTLDDLPLAWVDALAADADADVGADAPGPLARAGVGGDLRLGGAWSVELPAEADRPPRVSASLERRAGDLALQVFAGADGSVDDSRVLAGLREARLRVATDGRALRAQLRWDSERAGEASADLETALAPPDGTHPAWHWPAQAPLRGSLTARLPQVGVWSALAPPGWRVRGTVALQARVDGQRDAPRWSGQLQGDDMAVRSAVDGVAFINGQLRATLDGDRLSIDRLALEGRGGAARGGTLVASGSARWRTTDTDGPRRLQPLIELQATATRLRASVRPDRRLTASGTVQARLDGPRLTLRGGLRADEALILLPDELAPTLGSDVVVRGTTRPPEPDGLRVVPDVQLDLDLGPRFEVRGQGIDTRLEGQLSVRSTAALPTPRLLGEVRTAAGSYRAYGQRLSIETGVLRFTGPPDNPTLDITAVRPNSAQRVGVQIGGTAQAPRVRLFSEPELPDSEKLAWLVLGRPASGAGTEAAVLQQAALALIAGRGGDPAGGLAGAFGLDSIGVSTGTPNADGTPGAGALTLGKRLTNDLYLSYERSLAGALGTVAVFYDLSRRVTLRASAGAENAVDLIFTLQYD